MKTYVRPPRDSDYQKDNLHRLYGITVEEYDALLARQGGVCGLCGRPPDRKRLHVDHNHGTGAIRGLLCHHCNTGLGLLGESVERLSAAIEWLRG